MNPCKLKGQYGSRGSSGRIDKRVLALGEGKVCECKFAFLDSDPESRKRTSYLMEFGREGAKFKPYDPRIKPLRGLQVAVPCEETFQNKDSPGSKRYLRALGKKTKFRGCTSVEEYLVNAGLVAHQMDEENAPKTLLPGKRIKEGRLRDAVEFSDSSLGAHYHFLDAIFEDANSMFIEEKRFSEGPATSLADYFGLPSLNLKEATLERLYEEGEFADDGDLEATALILLFIGKDEELIKEALPWYPLSEFSSLEARIYKAVEQKMHPALKKYKEFWKKLTKRQKSALKLVYMKSLSVKKAAKKLKIDEYTLRDRLKGAKKKLFAHYEEYAHLKLRRNKKSPETDLAYGGFYRRSSAKKRHPVRQKSGAKSSA